jgi:drug/metabolite transporter (DMT)-like permease
MAADDSTAIGPAVSQGNEFIAEIQLIVSTILFGIAFVGQRFAMRSTDDDPIGALTFNAIRFSCSLIGLFFMRPLLKKYSASTDINEKNAADQDFIKRNGGSYGMLFWAVITGGSNFFGSWLTQNSLVALSAGKAGFITGSYVILIPFVEWLLPALFGYPVQCLHTKIWIGAFLCVVGMYFISGCTSDSTCLGGDQYMGEIYALGAVAFWAVNIMSVGLAAHQVDSVDLLLGQVAVVAVFSTIFGILLETDNWVYPFAAIHKYFLVSFFVGVVNVTAYFLCILGQVSVRPSRAAIIYSAGEALTACLFGYLLLGEALTHVELFGGLLMVIAACIAATADMGNDDDTETDDNIQAPPSPRTQNVTCLHNIIAHGEGEEVDAHSVLSPRVAGFGKFELRKCSSTERSYRRAYSVDIDVPAIESVELRENKVQYGSF